METVSIAPKLDERIDPDKIDTSDETFMPFEEQFVQEANNSSPEIIANEEKQSLSRKMGNFALKVAKGESVGTVVDIATIAAGVPLAVREVAGSTIDYKVYGEDGTEVEDKEQTKAKRLRKAIGTVALYSVSGMLAQKYGSEVAGAISDSLNDGTTGMYITPLVAKLGAVFGVNAAVNKLGR